VNLRTERRRLPAAGSIEQTFCGCEDLSGLVYHGAVRVLIAGCGYVGVALGERLVREGHSVAGMKRSPDSSSRLAKAGIEPVMADFTRPEQLKRLPRNWDWVVFAAAPARVNEAGYRAVYLDGIRRLVEWLRDSAPCAFLYTSSTSVYGQTDGSIVEETSPAEPASPTARVLVESEAVLRRAVPEGFPGIILRLAGIYGPGRNRLGALLRGEMGADEDGNRWVNMIHREDVVSAICAALESARAGEVFNVSDGHPVGEAELVNWLAEQLALDVADTSRGGGKPTRRGTNKRVSSEKLRDALGWAPRYPSFREGYAPLIEALRRPGATPV
jgi:nucleoside-diphosphate-sugar epimerase